VQTNDYLADNHGRTAMFTTVFFGVLDPASGALRYVNCGHDAPILLRATGEEERLESTGPALGAMRDVEFEPSLVQIGLGDMLVAFTDGVTDALDPAERAFGEEAFLPLIRKRPPSVTAMLGEIESALRAHIGTAPQFDDITLLALRRNPGRDESGSGSMSRTEPPPAPARGGPQAGRRRR
jgi:sigma-B regulation protein RsbU (phosphoserine phosphatase)